MKGITWRAVVILLCILLIAKGVSSAELSSAALSSAALSSAETSAANGSSDVFAGASSSEKSDAARRRSDIYESFKSQSQALKRSRTLRICKSILQPRPFAGCHMSVVAGIRSFHGQKSHGFSSDNDLYGLSEVQQIAYWAYKVCRMQNTSDGVSRYHNETRRAVRHFLFTRHAQSFSDFLAEENLQRRRWVKRMANFIWTNYERLAFGAPEMDPRTGGPTVGEWSLEPMFVLDNVDALWLFDMKESFYSTVRWMEMVAILEEGLSGRQDYIDFRNSLGTSKAGGKATCQCAELQEICAPLLTKENPPVDQVMEALTSYFEKCLPSFPLRSSAYDTTARLVRQIIFHMRTLPTFSGTNVEISFFETSIRALGGLLSAYVLSEEPILLYRSWDLGQRLSLNLVKCNVRCSENSTCISRDGECLNARLSVPCLPPRLFETGGWRNLSASVSKDHGPVLTTAAVTGSHQLEFRTLADFTGVCLFAQMTDDLIEYLVSSTGAVSTGLMPLRLTQQNDNRVFYERLYSIGAEGDSFYEYLIKSRIQSEATDSYLPQVHAAGLSFLRNHKSFVSQIQDPIQSVGFRSLLNKEPNPSHQDHWTALGTTKTDARPFTTTQSFRLGDNLTFTRMDSVSEYSHLGCFTGSLFFMSADLLKHDSPSLARDLQLKAEALTESCFTLYLSSPTGLAPEVQTITPTRSALRDPRGLLRPECLESLVGGYQHTSNIKYRNYGWQIVNAFMANARKSYGFCSVDDVSKHPPTYKGCRQDTWILSETLKYALMLFSPAGQIVEETMMSKDRLQDLRRRSRRAVDEIYRATQTDRAACVKSPMEFRKQLFPLGDFEPKHLDNIFDSRLLVPHMTKSPRSTPWTFTPITTKPFDFSHIQHKTPDKPGHFFNTEAHALPIIPNEMLFVVTGGSLSGLGKGTCASSIGVVLKAQGYRVTAIKIDPYLNVDAGTISPTEHGEVFVLKDGHEGDLDLGNYERALGVCLTKDHNVTTGKIYQRVISAERNGDYLGATVQMVPHVTNTIQNWIDTVSKVSVDTFQEEPDICLIEVGGTVGDIESSVYLEALSQKFARTSVKDCCLVHLTYLPTIGEEQKTKPSQHSFRALREAGMKPDFIMGRCKSPLTPGTREKLSIFSGVPRTHVFSMHDVCSSYLVPKLLIEQQLHARILEHFELPLSNPRAVTKFIQTPVEVYAEMAKRLQRDQNKPSTHIGIVGKYLGSNDTYLSLVKAIEHSAAESENQIEIDWIDSEYLHGPEVIDGDSETAALCEEQLAKLKKCNGIITPGGFGHRGVDGKIFAAQYARENNVPYLGICYGLHTMLIEGARNLLELKDATTEEIDPNAEHKIVVYMPETVKKKYGGTMRLGDRPTIIENQECLTSKLYNGKPVIHERHRHRYEVNREYVRQLEAVGYHFVGCDENGCRQEVVEFKNHPFFLGVQYHPEFTSRVFEPNPCILGLVLAAAGQLEDRLKKNGGQLRSGVGFKPTTTDGEAGEDNCPSYLDSHCKLNDVNVCCKGTSTTSLPASPKADNENAFQN